MMISILVVHIYLGKLPETFKFWLQSCVDNKSVDFLVVTDQQIVSPAKNITVHQTDLKSIKARLDSFAGFSTSLERPHKLCDYKPVWGLLFPEYISKYDFWGYCDNDLIFGDIRSFLTEEILSNYDYILGMGHFHIQRTIDDKFENVWKTARGIGQNAFYEKNFNPSRFNELDNGPQWNEVFTSPANHVFDEFPYGVSSRYYQLYPEKVWTGYAPTGRCFDDVDPMPLYLSDVFNCYDKYEKSHYHSLSHVFPFWERTKNNDSDIERVIYRKVKGTLLRVGVNANGNMVKIPCLYAHFLHRKMSASTKNAQDYIVIPNRFIDAEDITAKKIDNWSNAKMLIIERKWQFVKFQYGRRKALWRKIKQRMIWFL